MLDLSPQRSAALVALGGMAALGTAYVFQYGYGYVPCALCLWQRWPYYIGIPLALILAVTGKSLPPSVLKAGLAILALLFVVNAGIGIYHSGIEWKFWPGPATCSAGAAGPASGNLLDDLKATRIVPCDAASWRFLGLSFAGWNVVVSAALAGIAAMGQRRR